MRPSRSFNRCGGEWGAQNPGKQAPTQGGGADRFRGLHEGDLPVQHEYNRPRDRRGGVQTGRDTDPHAKVDGAAR